VSIRPWEGEGKMRVNGARAAKKKKKLRVFHKRASEGPPLHITHGPISITLIGSTDTLVMGGAKEGAMFEKGKNTRA